MLAEMCVGGVMACTHDHAPPNKANSPTFPSSAHKCTLTANCTGAHGTSNDRGIDQVAQQEPSRFGFAVEKQSGGLIEQRAREPFAGFSLASACAAYANWKGRLRTRLPVAAKIALATAGAMGGTAGSPAPPDFSRLGTTCASTTGISSMRSTS